MTLHDVEDVGRLDLVLAFRCHTCGSAVAVEFPTALQQAAIRFWLNRHPSLLARARPGPSAHDLDLTDDEGRPPPDGRRGRAGPGAR